MNPFVELPDFARLSDREMMLLLLLEVSELRAEVRASTSMALGLRKALGKPVEHDQFDKLQSAALDTVLREMTDRARQIKGGGQIPGNQ